ncbi:8376_t:CDS:1 [Dentiscutata erythropus]|uniref:8376_t:CDS:1 n=1 Tax=Dentiscutata erythropus TaxID=1348616 RepID=A0A9N9AEK6_9GLOM|nr:8376_t:CDS:1 [Dentiscutata erythropus]
MVNANEWLDEKIPKDQRAQATFLYVYRFCQSGHSTHNNDCSNCNNRNQNSHTNAPNYQFYNTILEGELDLNEFVNLQHLYIYGTGWGQDQQQMITCLTINKCNKLIDLQLKYAYISDITFGEDKRLKSQVEKLASIVRNIKGTNLGDLKLTVKKFEDENLEYEIAAIKSKLTEDCQLLLETLLEAQQEVLQNDNAFARKQLEKIKKRLSNVITAEKVEELLGKIVEINELAAQLNNLKIQENQ